jgi:hypothetical protein
MSLRILSFEVLFPCFVPLFVDKQCLCGFSEPLSCIRFSVVSDQLYDNEDVVVEAALDAGICAATCPFTGCHR